MSRVKFITTPTLHKLRPFFAPRIFLLQLRYVNYEAEQSKYSMPVNSPLIVRIVVWSSDMESVCLTQLLAATNTSKKSRATSTIRPDDLMIQCNECYSVINEWFTIYRIHLFSKCRLYYLNISNINLR